MFNKIGFISLGCDKNRVDTEIMLGYLQQAGYTLTGDLDEAEIIVVNTCGFINEAKEDSINAILDVAQYKEKGNCRYLLVTGCLAQRYGHELLMDMPEIDGVMGTGLIPEIVSVLKKMQTGDRVAEIHEPGYVYSNRAPRLLTTPVHTAYLKIAEGCNNCCSYCAIPAIRGPYRSREIEDILAEAEELCSKGIKELVIVAQDTTRYGLDLYGRLALADLLRELVTLKQCRWIRLMYCYPDYVTGELIKVMASSPKICRYMDLPLQHINPRILRLMNRPSSREKIINLIDNMRQAIPGLALRTTFIIGFPGETEAEFQELLDFMKQIKFERAGVFGFSPEEGTAAVSLPDKVSENVIAERVERAMLLQQQISLARNKKLVDRELTVLVEGWDVEVNMYWGRTEADAPDVDGKVYFAAEEEVRQGDFVRVRVLDAAEYDLLGVCIK